MPFKFEKLDIWKLAIDYANDVHLLTKTFPKDEMFNLSSQFKRAADSISLNISEGSIGQSNLEQRRFLGYAVRTVAECVNCLYLAVRRKYITQQQFDEYYKRWEELFAKILKFRSRLGNND